MKAHLSNMTAVIMQNIKQYVLLTLFFTGLLSLSANCQTKGMYPPFTKWYQDPLGLRPLELSTAFGFVWGSVTVAASLLLTKNDSSFQKKLSIYTEAGCSFGYKAPYTTVMHHDAGFLCRVRNWLGLGLEFDAFHFTDQINNTWTFGFMPQSGWYPYQNKKLAIFIQYGAGVSYSLNRFPLTGTGWDADTGRTGTKFNFLSKYGLGLEFHLTKQILLQTSVKHFHLSNGNVDGIERNPSHDSNGYYIRIIYYKSTK